MKKLIILIILILFACTAQAGEVFKINSVNFDTSNAVIVFTAQDTADSAIMNDIKLTVLDNPKRAYFDIDSAVLAIPKQDWTFSSTALKQIIVTQFSTNPDKVRTVMYLDENFNPDNIKFLRVKNNIIIKLKGDICQNGYFHNTYRDEHSSSGDFYEYTTITAPDASQKELKLNTGYYLQSITPKPDTILLNGFGELTIEHPLLLSNPSRIVFDLSNTLVDPKIRNTEYKINETDTVKLGQFSANKARIVIYSENIRNFIPLYSVDNQSLVITNHEKVKGTSFYNTTNDIVSYGKEKPDEQTNAMLLTFNSPLVHSVDRTNTELIVYLLNTCKYDEAAFKAAYAGTPFAQAKLTNFSETAGPKLTVPLARDIMVSTYLSSDSKVLKIKVREPKKPKPQPAAQPAQLNATPVKKTVILDPGHGGSDHGAIRENISEKFIVMDISKRVGDILTKAGYDVKTTRTNDTFISLEDRVVFSEKNCADVFVSIHVNASEKPEITGIETHYYRQESIDLAQCVHTYIASAIQSANRGLFKSKFYVINHTTAPAILVEIGFLSNDAERAELVSEKRKQATAKAIADGIQNYFKQFK
jgi:N-acetylmuramoyl-L-alanine amidase